MVKSARYESYPPEYHRGNPSAEMIDSTLAEHPAFADLEASSPAPLLVAVKFVELEGPTLGSGGTLYYLWLGFDQYVIYVQTDWIA
jgi:hypothetical protein